MTAPGSDHGILPPRRVLVVDDDGATRLLVRRALEADGFEIADAASGPEALASIRAHSPDAMILDLGLPGMSGLDVLREVRRAGDLPVLVLSGRVEETDRVLALEIGADDYVVKPFLPRELAARVRALLRRAGTDATTHRLEFDGLVIDRATREVTSGGNLVELTAKEFDLLTYLAAAPRHVHTREELLREVWDSSGQWQDPDTVTEHVRRVRRKIEIDPEHPAWIQTVRGVGYRFEPHPRS